MQFDQFLRTKARYLMSKYRTLKNRQSLVPICVYTYVYISAILPVFVFWLAFTEKFVFVVVYGPLFFVVFCFFVGFFLYEIDTLALALLTLLENLLNDPIQWFKWFMLWTAAAASAFLIIFAYCTACGVDWSVIVFIYTECNSGIKFGWSYLRDMIQNSAVWLFFSQLLESTYFTFLNYNQPLVDRVWAVFDHCLYGSCSPQPFFNHLSFFSYTQDVIWEEPIGCTEILLSKAKSLYWAVDFCDPLIHYKSYVYTETLIH